MTDREQPTGLLGDRREHLSAMLRVPPAWPTRRSAPAARKPLQLASACRRSVTSRATAYMSRSFTTGVDVHSSTLGEPSLANITVLERRRRLSLTERRRLGRAVLSRSSGWTRSRYGRARTSSRVYRELLDAGLDRVKWPSKSATGDQIGREREDAVQLPLRPGAPRRVDSERAERTAKTKPARG